MTPADAADRLRSAGLTLDPGQITIEVRTDCFAATLPGQRMAWFPANDRGRKHLAVERRVLALLAERCTHRVPRVLFTALDGWDLRAIVPGEVDPQGYAARLKVDTAAQLRLSEYLALALAEQHTRIKQNDIGDFLPNEVSWPPAWEAVLHNLPQVVEDPRLLARVTAVMDTYYKLAIGNDELALVHSDLGFHNIAFDPTCCTANGIFDYGDAAWADRHHDFRYLVFGAIQDTLLDATMRAYTAATGFRLSRARILFYNAACAIGHLADRVGTDPADVVAGRTLAQDLGWTLWALKRSGF